MNEIQLNLARKWRASSFDQIIGQDLVVRMLKNSLYLNQFFPVYLLSGNRGCGKTSTARVFAAAINCEQLGAFQQNPKSVRVPCGQCSSCVAMRAGKHPDFFEIDAASHTGVDTIRAVIDSSSFMPVLGRKKIYLVDEAHMLSKAAFNALLKLLEEPPQAVLFMLATTDPQKIIETVKSRCFQLLFKSVEQDTLVKHLATICDAESVTYDIPGLQLICKETDGCVRDAINVLEQVRFAGDAVTKKTVHDVLGYLDDERLIKLFEYMLYKGPEELMHYLNEIQFPFLSVDRVFEQLLGLVRDAVWVKHGVMPPYGADRAAALKSLIASCSWQRLHEIGRYFYEHEQQFMRTTQKHALLEVLLLQLCKKNDPTMVSGTPAAAPSIAVPSEMNVGSTQDDTIDDDQAPSDEPVEEEAVVQPRAACGDKWQLFLEKVAALHDPLVLSIFKQGRFAGYDEAKSCVTLAFAEEYLFFKEWLSDTQAVWLPPMQEIFSSTVTCVPQFMAGEKVQELPKAPSSAQPVIRERPVDAPAPKPVMREAPRSYNAFARQKPFQPRVPRGPIEERVDVSDKQRWATATMLLEYFPGTITKVQEKAI